MMDTKRDLSIYLMKTMEAAGRVQQALAALGVSVADVAAARRRVEAAGLMDLVRTVEQFERCLGVPDELQSLDGEGQRLYYRLSPWPQLWFAVVADAKSMVTDLRFLWPTDAPPPRLEPWECLEADAPRFGTVRTVVDEWFPHKGLVLEQQGRFGLLRFEYGLLQSVTQLDAEEAVAIVRENAWRTR